MINYKEANEEFMRNCFDKCQSHQQHLHHYHQLQLQLQQQHIAFHLPLSSSSICTPSNELYAPHYLYQQYPQRALSIPSSFGTASTTNMKNDQTTLINREKDYLSMHLSPKGEAMLDNKHPKNLSKEQQRSTMKRNDVDSQTPIKCQPSTKQQKRISAAMDVIDSLTQVQSDQKINSAPVAGIIINANNHIITNQECRVMSNPTVDQHQRPWTALEDAIVLNSLTAIRIRWMPLLSSLPGRSWDEIDARLVALSMLGKAAPINNHQGTFHFQANMQTEHPQLPAKEFQFDSPQNQRHLGPSTKQTTLPYSPHLWM